MTMKEVADLTGYAESTVRKYAPQLEIEYFGSGQHKVYNWKKADVDRLNKAVIGRGRPPKKRCIKMELIKELIWIVDLDAMTIKCDYVHYKIIKKKDYVDLQTTWISPDIPPDTLVINDIQAAAVTAYNEAIN